MKALQFDDSIARYAVAKVLGRVHRSAFWGPLSPIRYREVPEPALPGPQWVKVRTRYGGICGSDLNTIRLADSPSLSAFVSFPSTLGHENVGILAEVGDEVEGFQPGDRVVVEPTLACAVRGVEPPCDACRRGETALCRHFTHGPLSSGLELGSCRDVGGSWSPFFVAHRSQLYRVPDHVSDENALMVEPFAVGLHAVLRHMPSAGETALVLGSGVIGLCVVAALRALGCTARLIAVARYEFQEAMARRLGADHVLRARGEDLYRAAAEATGASLLKPILGKPVLVGGADVVFECVGSATSVDDSLRLVRSGGTVVLIGLAGLLRQVDWTPVWLNEVQVLGSFIYGMETFQGRRLHTFDLALDQIGRGSPDLSFLVTHRFRLHEYRRALAAAASRNKNRLIKAVFAFDQ